MSFELAIENEDGLKASEIMDKIRHVVDGCANAISSDGSFRDEGAHTFLELLKRYPQSICTRKISDKLKLIIALHYQESLKPAFKDDDWKGYSYEELGILFDRSKASIFQAIHEKETQAKQMLEDMSLKKEVHSVAFAELVEEEKRRILAEKINGIDK